MKIFLEINTIPAKLVLIFSVHFIKMTIDYLFITKAYHQQSVYRKLCHLNNNKLLIVIHISMHIGLGTYKNIDHINLPLWLYIVTVVIDRNVNLNFKLTVNVSNLD